MQQLSPSCGESANEPGTAPLSHLSWNPELPTLPSPLCQVKLLDASDKDPALRLRAANLLGLLVRHAATVSPGLAAAGACEALAAAIRQAGWDWVG